MPNKWKARNFKSLVTLKISSTRERKGKVVVAGEGKKKK